MGDALEAPDLAGVGEGVPADAEALCLGSGEDALRCRELVDGCYVVRMLHVAIVRKFQTFATSKCHTPTMRLRQGQSKGGNAALILALLKISPRDPLRFAVSLNRWVCVCAGVDAENRPIGNLSQWDDLLFGLKATLRSRFIADDGWNELQKSEDSNSRKQIVQLSSRSISAGNLVFSS